jgi:hypothetical protein
VQNQNCEIFGHRTNPTLFSIFIDDPVDEINELGLGVNIRDSKLSILLYADDIVTKVFITPNRKAVVKYRHNAGTV